MLFAINYSPQAAELLQSGAIEIDRFKCASDWPQLIPEARQHRPIYIHFNLMSDPQMIAQLDVDEVNTLCAETETPYVNLHLGIPKGVLPEIGTTSTDAHDRAAAYEYMLAGVQEAVARFGAERVIVENIPYYGPGHWVRRPTVEPEAIRAIVEETGVGFLLDISHARLSARHMGLDEHAYLAQMPGQALRELHVTGIGHDPTGRVRDHLQLTEADWPFVEWVLARVHSGEWASPWMMAFEYGGLGPLFEWRSEAAVIAAQVPRLYELVHGG